MPDGTVIGADRLRLAKALADIWSGTGLSQEAFGSRVGTGHHQTWVSKVARGEITPSDQAIREWCAVTETDPGPILELAPRARIETRSVRTLYAAAGGGAGYQAALGELEKRTRVKRKFMPFMIPAELQVSGYAMALLRAASGPIATGGATEEDLPGIVAQRMANQAILYEPDRKIQVVMLESALWHPMAPPEVMRAQLDRLLAVGGAPALEFGIIPFGRVLPVAPLTGFLCFDDAQVTIESAAGPTDLTDPEDVARYLHWFELLRETAVYGPDIAPLVHRAIAGLTPAD